MNFNKTYSEKLSIFPKTYSEKLSIFSNKIEYFFFCYEKNTIYFCRLKSTCNHLQKNRGRNRVNKLKMKHIVILENHQAYGEGIRYYFQSNPEFQLEGIASTGAEFFKILANTPADMALVGVNLPDENNYADLALRLKKEYPTIKTLAIVSEDTETIVQSMMKAGIKGYIGKRQANPQELGIALQLVASGNKYIGQIDKKNTINICKC